MREIRFLSTEQVLEIHRQMIDRYGGDPGVRDVGLIESASLMPQQTFGGRLLHPSVGAMAAVLPGAGARRWLLAEGRGGGQVFA